MYVRWCNLHVGFSVRDLFWTTMRAKILLDVISFSLER